MVGQNNNKPAPIIVRGGLGLSSLTKPAVTQVKNVPAPDIIKSLGTQGIAQPAVRPSIQETGKE